MQLSQSSDLSVVENKKRQGRLREPESTKQLQQVKFSNIWNNKYLKILVLTVRYASVRAAAVDPHLLSTQTAYLHRIKSCIWIYNDSLWSYLDEPPMNVFSQSTVNTFPKDVRVGNLVGLFVCFLAGLKLWAREQPTRFGASVNVDVTSTSGYRNFWNYSVQLWGILTNTYKTETK